MAKWSIDIDKLAEKMGKSLKDLQKSYAFGLYASIIKNTPVAEHGGGRARGNWNISVGRDDPTVTENKTPKYTNKNQLPEPSGDESIFISNNLPYINVLEHGGYGHFEGETWIPANGPKTVNGYSKQSPKGMVGVSVANSAAIFKAAVREVYD